MWSLVLAEGVETRVASEVVVQRRSYTAKTVREPNIYGSRDDNVNTGSEVNIENRHENGSGNKG
ncbi:hypothetical protein KP509_03G051500 [Ceratopteris richardii]|uniref:Uncharacterized protein n=1 Tax=Ceratopteris richardii TaxID=49495 RepID=A0A8T2V767_CERRI|nr:hypothetical protein KP509_03G051500 [Ceratopteris richardii]